MLSFTLDSYGLFTLRSGMVLERFQNGSYCSVNRRGMVLKGTVPGETVPPQVRGPNQSRTVSFASENDDARKRLFTPLVSHVTGSWRAQRSFNT